MPILFIIFLTFAILAIMYPKKKEEYTPTKYKDDYQGYMCTACWTMTDDHVDPCPCCGMSDEEFRQKEKSALKPKGPEFPNAKFTCKYCTLKTIDEYYFCPRCGKDDKGLTEEENKAINKNFVVPDKEWE